jgi:DNA-binding response OmpR family regulator
LFEFMTIDGFQGVARVRVAVLTGDGTLLARLRSLLGAAECRLLPRRLDGAVDPPLHQLAADLLVIDGCDLALDRSSMGRWLQRRAAARGPAVMVVEPGGDAARAAHWLDAGADDVVARTLEAVELQARVRALLRRSMRRPPEPETLELAGFRLDRRHESLFDRGLPIALTRREFAMAWLFLSRPHMVLSRRLISRTVWGADPETTARTMEQHVHRLRLKLNLNEARGVLIRAAYARGYRLELVGRFLKSV